MRNGFTLVEILVAMLLLAGISGVAFNSFSSSSKLASGSFKEVTAYNLARRQLEYLYESVRADQWAAAGFPLSTVGPAPQPGNIVLDGITYGRVYTVTSIDVDGGGEDYRRVRVTMTW